MVHPKAIVVPPSDDEVWAAHLRKQFRGFPQLGDVMVSRSGEFLKVRQVHPDVGKVVGYKLARKLIATYHDCRGRVIEAHYKALPSAPARGVVVVSPVHGGSINGSCTGADGQVWNVTHPSLPVYVCYEVDDDSDRDTLLMNRCKVM